MGVHSTILVSCHTGGGGGGRGYSMSREVAMMRWWDSHCEWNWINAELLLGQRWIHLTNIKVILVSVLER